MATQAEAFAAFSPEDRRAAIENYINNPNRTAAEVAAAMDVFGVSAAEVAAAYNRLGVTEANGQPVNASFVQQQYAAVAPTEKSTATGMLTGGATTQTAGAGTTTVGAGTTTTGQTTTQAATTTTATGGGAQQNQLLSGIILTGDSWLSGDSTLANRIQSVTGTNSTNFAVGGSKSSDTLALLNNYISGGGKFAPNSTVVLNVGGNDFLQGVSREDTRNNIDSMLSTLNSQGVKVVLSGAPNINSVNDITSSSSDKKLQIDPIYTDLANKYKNVTLVNSMPELLSNSELRNADVIHLNPEGQLRFSNDIVRAVNSTNTPENILPDRVRAAFESQSLTMDQYNTLARYFNNPLLIDEATRDPDQPTIREYVGKGRSGYEFATFAATRAPQYGGQLGTGSQSEQLGKLGALVAPYIGVASSFTANEDGTLTTTGPGGRPLTLVPTGDNKYLAGIGSPLYGAGKIRYNAGLEYTLDPQTNQLTLSSPSIQAFETTSDGDVLKQVVGFIAPIALNYLFPGLGATIGGTLAAGASAATQIALGNAIVAGLTTGAITGDVERGLISAALVGGGSYLSNTGALGDFMEGANLGDYAKQFNIPTSATIADGSFYAADAAQLAAQGLSPTAIAQNLTQAGLGPGVAQNIAQLAANGASATQLQQALTSTPGGMFTANVSDAQFVAADAAQLAQQGLNPAQIEQTLLSSGVDPFIAADAAQLAGQGLNAGSIAQNLTQAGADLPGGLFTTTGGTTLPGAAGAGAGAGTGTTAGTTAGGTGLTAGQALQAGGLLSNIVGGGTPGAGLPGGLIGAGIDLAQLAALRSEATGLGRQLAGEAAQIGREAAVPFTPYTVTTGAGVGTVGPGGATAVTSPEMQALRQQQLGLAGQAFGAINPAQAAQTLYGQVEALAAPGRAREQEALLAGLQQRGLTGFGQNLPTVGGGVRTVNPLFESLLSAQETARAQQALQAQQFGTQEAVRQAALGQGLVTGAQGIDQQALAALNAASILGQQERAQANRNAALRAQTALAGLELRAPYEQAGLYFTGQALTGAGDVARGMFGLPTQQGNLTGGLNALAQYFSGRGGTNISQLGEGTGPAYGFQDYGIFF